MGIIPPSRVPHIINRHPFHRVGDIDHRHPNELGGFATRIRSFGRTEQGFDAGETLLVSRFGELDNMEGISAWRDPEGRIRLTLISDDNFFPLQRTQLNEYILTDDAASG